MFNKAILISLFLSFNPGVAGETNLDEIKINLDKKTVSEHLNDYYSEFKQPTTIKDNCKCDSNPIPKPKTLTDYYFEYL